MGTEAISSKEIVINNIIAAMAPALEAEKLRILEATVRNCLYGLKLEEECTQLMVRMEDNEKILRIFLASKKLEGLKDKSLEQYRMTAQQLFRWINKDYREIEKDDIKTFLAYRMRTVSPNTLQNSRRNLS
ncbi:MAG: phage integrase N-terminal SAM-like domain-containing protein, partial [Eubacteriales bacterium]|nr:phage integrase N-terminal SAM-like domain-containing protein [Eubacteriales bacterium]